MEETAMFGFEFADDAQILETFDVENLRNLEILDSRLSRIGETEQLFAERESQQRQKIVCEVSENQSRKHEAHIRHCVFAFVSVTELQTLLKSRC